MIDTLERNGPSDFNTVAQTLNRSVEDCQAWFNFLRSIAATIPHEDKKKHRPKRKRIRRKSSEIDRAYKCRYPGCSKSYGTEGALKYHMTTKHKDFKYVPTYLLSSYTQKGDGGEKGGANSVGSGATNGSLTAPHMWPGNEGITEILHHHQQQFVEHGLVAHHHHHAPQAPSLPDGIQGGGESEVEVSVGSVKTDPVHHYHARGQ